jgi:hypothetical protein
MQIREITIQEGLGWELTKGIGRAARDQFIQKATGLSDPYATTEMPGTQKTPGPVDTATVPAPAAKPPLKPVGFNAANIMQQPGMQKYAEKPRPNYAQTGQMNYKPATVTTNAAPKVNPAAAPVIYTLDGRRLDPKNLGDAGVIKQLQAQGLTSGYLK